MVMGGDPGLPAGLDDDRGMGFDQQRGAGERVAGAHGFAAHVAGVVPGAVGVEIRFQGGLDLGLVAHGGRKLGLVQVGGLADRLDRDRLDHQGLVARVEAETGAVGLGETGGHLGNRAEGHGKRRVGAFHLQHYRAHDPDRLRRHTLAFDLAQGIATEPVEVRGGE